MSTTLWKTISIFLLQLFLFNSSTPLLAATHLIEPGVPQAVNQLLDVHSKHRFKSEKINQDFVGKGFKELFNYYKNNDLLCIGLYSENEAIGYSDILSTESDELDRFIEKKLRDSGHGLIDTRIDVMLNPEDDIQIKEGQGAILIIWKMITII